MDLRTREGRKMSGRVVAKLERVLLTEEGAEDALSYEEIGERAGVSAKTAYRYLTPEFKVYLGQKRAAALAEEDMRRLDRGLLQRAEQGDLAAAKLLYQRWDKREAGLTALANGDEADILAALERL